MHELNLLTLPVNLRGLFGVLKKHLGVLVPQLDLLPIKHLLSKHVVNPILVTFVLHLDTLLEHLHLLGISVLLFD